MDQHEQLQRDVCTRYSAEFTPINWQLRVAIADDFFSDAIPKNGVRLPVDGNMTGWYLYAGETMSDTDDYFKPHCAEHLRELLPSVIPFLGLPVDWRFLLAPDHEDVWNGNAET